MKQIKIINIKNKNQFETISSNWRIITNKDSTKFFSTKSGKTQITEGKIINVDFKNNIIIFTIK